MKEWAPRFALRKWLKVIRKWPIAAVSILALPGNGWVFAHVFVLEVGHLKLKYQPRAGICLPRDHPRNFGTLVDLVLYVHDESDHLQLCLCIFLDVMVCSIAVCYPTLLDVLVCSVTVYFCELCCILANL